MNNDKLKKYVGNKLILLNHSLLEEQSIIYYEACDIAEQNVGIAEIQGEINALTMVYALMDKGD